jgi:hypothetical protein
MPRHARDPLPETLARASECRSGAVKVCCSRDCSRVRVTAVKTIPALMVRNGRHGKAVLRERAPRSGRPRSGAIRGSRRAPVGSVDSTQ